MKSCIVTAIACLLLVSFAASASVLMHRRSAFRGGGGGLTASPTHWWDLDDDGTWSDDGTVGGWALTETGTVTVTSSAGPGGQDVADFDTSSFLEKISAGAPDGYTSLSASAWVRFDTLNLDSSSGDEFYQWGDGNVGSANAFTLRHFGGSQDDYLPRFYNINNEVTTPDMTTATWYHVALTWDGTTVRHYVDGTERGTDTVSVTLSTSTLPIYIGASYRELGTYKPDCQIGMVGLWDAELTADDITYLYNSGNGRKFADL